MCVCVYVGGLSVAVHGPSKAEIRCADNGDYTYTVTYYPLLAGLYDISVQFAGKHIAGSPFTAKVVPPGMNTAHLTGPLAMSCHVSVHSSVTDCLTLKQQARRQENPFGGHSKEVEGLTASRRRACQAARRYRRRESRRRRRRGGEKWGGGIPLPSQLGIWGSVVSSPSGVRGGALAEINQSINQSINRGK